MQKILDSGAILDLSICSFAEGNRLLKAVARELKNTKLALGIKDVKGFQDIFKLDLGDDAVNTIKNLLTGLIASEDIEAALWPCMERGSYTIDGVQKKINRDLFEDEKARADYIPILKEALVFNLTPFFANLKSLLQGIPGVNTASPK